MDLFVNKILCGFRKTHCTQHTLFKLLHSWQKELDNSGFISHFSWTSLKRITVSPHGLIIAKFEAYGLSKNSLKLLLDYLEGQKPRVKIGYSYSFWSEVKRVVPQVSILRPYFLIFLSLICLCLLRTVKSVILLVKTPFTVMEWNYLAF